VQPMAHDSVILLFVAICVSPVITAALCAVWRNLELSSREQDPRRFPRYGAGAGKPKD